MAIKSKNKAVTVTLVVVMLYLWAVALFAASDFMQHKKYIDKNYYFSSPAFTNEIGLFTRLFISYHIQYANYAERSVQDKIGTARYNDMKAKSEQAMKEKENSFFQSYAVKIDQAQRSADPNAVAQWTEERDRKISEARKQNDQAFEESVQKLLAYKNGELADLKHSLDLRSGFIKYYIRNVKTGETYFNMNSVPATLEELKATPDYQTALTNVLFPLPLNESRSLQSVNQSFVQNQLEGILIIPADSKGLSKFQADYTYFLNIRERILQELYLGGASLAIGIGIFLYLRKRGGWKGILSETRAMVKRKVPVDIRSAVCIFVFLIPLIIWLGEGFFYFPLNGLQPVQLTVVALLLGLVLLHLAGAVRWLRPANRNELCQEWERSLCCCLYRLGQESWANKGLLFKLLCLLASTVLLGLLLGLMIEDSGPPNEYALVTFIYTILYLLLAAPFILRFVAALNRIIEGTEQLAAGNFEAGIPVKGSGQLSSLAHHLNHMRQGFQQALEDRMKSERMKSELITNVSHDLKTPLTSIINYVNLLKRESATLEEKIQYIEVLDRKTERLKVLIDDLFEASKMASGAVEFHYDKVDVVALMHQAMAEFNEKIEEASLTFRVNACEPHMYARLDGKKTWRVFENLISNAVKFSLAGTRVFITLTEQQEHIEIRMQNVSAYEIDFEVEELFERFKRGDQSRHTEGSGLGLAIAKSIIELQGGELQIELDGDQFKVMIRFRK